MTDVLPAPFTPESMRLAALASYDILDTLPEADYDAITQIAAYICQTPIALITLVDHQRQWFKSAYGISFRETPRQIAFCDYAIQTPNELLEISDARADERFATNPSVTSEPPFIFYAGVPLVNAEGYALGTLCVIDHQTRQLSTQQTIVLKALARQVATHLDLRRSQAQLEQAGGALRTLNGALHQTNRLLKTVTDTCPAGLALWEAVRDGGIIVDFRYVFSNPLYDALVELTGQQMAAGFLKSGSAELLANGLFDRLVDGVGTRQIQHFQQYSQRNQSVSWGEVTLTPYGDGVLIAIQDITQFKESERILQQSLQREQELNRLKSQFVSTASHGFRTPLATIQSSVELVKLHLERPSPQSQPAIQRHLSIIEEQVFDVNNLLSEVLTIGKVETGQISYAPQPVDLLALVSEVISTHYSGRQDGRSVRLSITGSPRIALLDAQLITHVLVNLLSNAFKFSTHNPDLEIIFEEFQLILRIRDQGIGVPEAELPQLFSSFFRAGNAENVPGSGLGLVIAHQFVLIHGGELAIESKENVGTICTVTLPA